MIGNDTSDYLKAWGDEGISLNLIGKHGFGKLKAGAGNIDTIGLIQAMYADEQEYKRQQVIEKAKKRASVKLKDEPGLNTGLTLGLDENPIANFGKPYEVANSDDGLSIGGDLSSGDSNTNQDYNKAYTKTGLHGVTFSNATTQNDNVGDDIIGGGFFEPSTNIALNDENQKPVVLVQNITSPNGAGQVVKEAVQETNNKVYEVYYQKEITESYEEEADDEGFWKMVNSKEFEDKIVNEVTKEITKDIKKDIKKEKIVKERKEQQKVISFITESDKDEDYMDEDWDKLENETINHVLGVTKEQQEKDDKDFYGPWVYNQKMRDNLDEIFLSKLFGEDLDYNFGTNYDGKVVLNKTGRDHLLRKIDSNRKAFLEGYQYWDLKGNAVLITKEDDGQDYYVKRRWSLYKENGTGIRRVSNTVVESNPISEELAFQHKYYNGVSDPTTYCVVIPGMAAKAYDATDVYHFQTESGREQDGANVAINLELGVYNTDTHVYEPVTWKDAQRYANQGGLVIAASYRLNSNYQLRGHAALVTARNNVTSESKMEIYQTGGTRNGIHTFGFNTIRDGFGHRALINNEIKYYVWRKR